MKKLGLYLAAGLLATSCSDGNVYFGVGVEESEYQIAFRSRDASKVKF